VGSRKKEGSRTAFFPMMNDGGSRVLAIIYSLHTWLLLCHGIVFY
jgi:hypothetical protein